MIEIKILGKEKQVSDTDPRYVEARKTQQGINFIDTDNEVWGRDFLRNYEKIDRKNEKEKRHFLVDHFEVFFLQGDMRRELLADMYSPAVADFFLSRVELLKSFKGKDIDFTKILEVLPKLLEISDGDLYDFAHLHTNLVEQEKVKLKNISEKVKANIRQKVNQYVTEGLIPSSVLANLHRLDTIQVLYKDRLVDMDAISVGFLNKGGAISIYSEYLQEGKEAALEHVLTHEFIHEIDGSAISLKEMESDPYKFNLSWHYKSGLEVKGGTWINEAAKEILARKISGFPSKFYNAYVDKIHDLRKDKILADGRTSKGLDIMILWEANFENWQYSDEERKILEDAKKLRSEGKEIEAQVLLKQIEHKSIAKSKYRKLIEEVNRIQKERENDDFGWLNLCRSFGENV